MEKERLKMKKKLQTFIVLMTILCLSLLFTACTQSEDTEKQETTVSKTNEANEEKEMSKETKEPEEVKTEEAKTEEAKTEEAKTEETKTDQPVIDIEGEELLQSLTNNRPEKMMIKSEMTSFGMTMTITTYYDGKNSRTESDIPDLGKSILIYLADEGVMYQYVYGEEEGVKMTGANQDYASEMGLMTDTSLFAEILDQGSPDMTAKKDTLDGEEVIYIEATESDEDIGEALVKMWYSEKYATPLKYEMIMGETVVASMHTTKITDKVSMDESLFLPPEDVNFQEVDMEAMMEMEIETDE